MSTLLLCRTAAAAGAVSTATWLLPAAPARRTWLGASPCLRTCARYYTGPPRRGRWAGPHPTTGNASQQPSLVWWAATPWGVVMAATVVVRWQRWRRRPLCRWSAPGVVRRTRWGHRAAAMPVVPAMRGATRRSAGGCWCLRRSPPHATVPLSRGCQRWQTWCCPLAGLPRVVHVVVGAPQWECLGWWRQRTATHGRGGAWRGRVSLWLSRAVQLENRGTRGAAAVEVGVGVGMGVLRVVIPNTAGGLGASTVQTLTRAAAAGAAAAAARVWAMRRAAKAATKVVWPHRSPAHRCCPCGGTRRRTHRCQCGWPHHWHCSPMIGSGVGARLAAPRQAAPSTTVTHWQLCLGRSSCTAGVR